MLSPHPAPRTLGGEAATMQMGGGLYCPEQAWGISAHRGWPM